MYGFNNSYSIDMFNIIPFKNLIFYINKINEYNLNIVIYNLIYPIIVWIPMGVFFNTCSILKNINRKKLVFISSLFLASVIRVILLVGFFDIDKIILGYIGFCIGNVLYKNILIKFIKQG